MNLFINGFWDGFIEKTNPVNITFFIDLFKEVFNEEIELGTLECSDILLESIFSEKTYLFDKKWKYTFLFSGESRLNKYSNEYTCVLYGERNHENIINLPLFIPNIYCSNFIEKLSFPKCITEIPEKNVCAVISNPNGKERNAFLSELEKTITIDYGGTYKKNVNSFLDSYNSESFLKEVSKYKFIVSMENSYGDTYITEKILHGLIGGSIPIYWGSNRICDYFNKDRIIILKDASETDSCIKLINELANNNVKYIEMINKPIFNSKKLQRNISEISNDIKNLIFDRQYKNISRIFTITSQDFEKDRYNRLNQMFEDLGINNYNTKYICPTYKQTISDEIMDIYVKKNLVKKLRINGMKRSEISLFLNYKAVLEYIEKNYLDGLFLIFESDIYIQDNTIDKLSDFIKDVIKHKEKFDLIHIGKGGEDLYFGKPYCDGILPYRDRVTNLPEIFVEDITNVNDKYRLIRKFHTRCTDSFIWSYNGIIKFLKYMNDFPEYDAPFDYYMTNFLETNLEFKHYWSLDTFFIQGSNYGLEASTIQNDWL